MGRLEISSATVAKPPRPYSQAVSAGNLIAISGQVSTNIAGAVVGLGNIAEQTAQVLDNMEALLRSVGLGLEHVVQTTVFLADFADYQGMNDVYEARFSSPYPARSTLGVTLVNDDYLVEIEALAVKD